MKQTIASYFLPGTLAANHVIYVEKSCKWTLLGIKAATVNDSDLTIALSGAYTKTAAVVGDGDPAYIEPTNPAPIDADELLVLTIDYDGSSGTAGEGLSILVEGLPGY